MKTFKEILDDKMGMRDYFPIWQEKQLIEAAKAYASQAIDECAKNAKIDEMLLSEGVTSVSISSITAVKKDLK